MIEDWQLLGKIKKGKKIIYKAKREKRGMTVDNPLFCGIDPCNPENIIIIARGKTLSGQTVITYVERDYPELKRIKIVEEVNDKNEFENKY